MTTRKLRDDEGAEAIEFAIAFPVLALLIIGLLYGLFAVAAHISLAHATSKGARYASIATDPVTSSYPTPDDVAAEIDEHTPFFSADSCDVAVDGATSDNAVVTLEVGCDFPNPLTLI